MRWTAVFWALLFAGCLSTDGSPDLPVAPEPEPTAGQAESEPPETPPVQRPPNVVNSSNDPGRSGEDEEPAWIIHQVSGTTSINAAMWGMGVALCPGSRVLEVYIPPDALGVRWEVGWADGIQDLDAEVALPQPNYSTPPGECTGPKCQLGIEYEQFCDRDGTIAAPDSPSTVFLSAEAIRSHSADQCSQPFPPVWPDDCNVWSFGFRSKDINVQLAWQGTLTIFLDGGAPTV